jgi:hypothetical protein
MVLDINASNSIIRARKSLISYYKTRDTITTFNNHLNVDHAVIAIVFEKEANN